jgi:hypothetical protein
MKQKLKLLLAYFKAYKKDYFDTFINFDYNRIEDWNGIFANENRQIYFELPTKLNEIFVSIVDLYMRDFHRENNYEESDWWSLIVTIHPNENRINFKSDCLFVNESDQQKYFSLKKGAGVLSEDIIYLVNSIFEEHLSEEDEEIEFEFSGSDNELDVYNFSEVIHNDDQFLDLTQNLMTKVAGKYWDEQYGAYGEINIVKNSHIQMDYFVKSGEYGVTLMDINVTPENIKQ